MFLPLCKIDIATELVSYATEMTSAEPYVIASHGAKWRG
jgi:hypothetical protein